MGGGEVWMGEATKQGEPDEQSADSTYSSEVQQDLVLVARTAMLLSTAKIQETPVVHKTLTTRFLRPFIILCQRYYLYTRFTK
jgi:hypothetical protein